MPRYIDADLLWDKISRAYLFSDRRGTMGYVKQCLNEAPTADVEPVRHGHWRELSAHRDDDGYIVRDYECTCCFGIETDVPDVDNSELEELDRYCPMCGAKMDGGEQ